MCVPRIDRAIFFKFKSSAGNAQFLAVKNFVKINVYIIFKDTKHWINDIFYYGVFVVVVVFVTSVSGKKKKKEFPKLWIRWNKYKRCAQNSDCALWLRKCQVVQRS